MASPLLKCKMKKNISTNKKILLLTLCSQVFAVFANGISLDDAVGKYTLLCPSVKELQLSYDNSELEFDNYKKGFLPTLSMDLTPVNFNRSLRLLQNSLDGDYNYVTDYSYTGSAELSISQKIGITGGTLQAGSSLSFLREFTNDRNSYNTSPLYVSYNQPLRGGFKQYRYTRELQHLREDISLKDFCQSVSSVQQEVLSLYLTAYSSKLQLELSERNISTGDTLLRLARLKLDNGYITKFDYNKIELQQLHTQLTEKQAKYDLRNNLANMAIKLGLTDNMDIDAPDPTLLPDILDYATVLELVRRNNPQALNVRLQQIQAEYERYSNKLQTRFNGSVSLSYGLNQYATTIANAYRHPDERQAVSVTLSIPIFQWGISRNKRVMADNDYKSAMLKLDESESEFENSIRKQTNSYNMSRNNFLTAQRSLELSKEQYRLATTRFMAGKISVYELTQVFDSQQSALNSYFSAVQQVFVQYYGLRHLALYDFVQGRTLSDIFTNNCEQ